MDPFRSKVCTPWPCVQMPPLLETTKCPESLCPIEALPRSARSLLHRVGGRYPSFLAPTDSCARPSSSHSLQLSPRPVSLCRFSPVPAGCWPFPTLSLHVFPWMLGPIPRRLPRCLCPFLPRGLRPSPRFDGVGSPAIYPYSDFRTGNLFRGCRHSFMFRPPSLLATQVAPTDTTITVWPPWLLLPSIV